MEVGVALVHKEPALAACPQEMRTAQLRYCRAALEVRKLRKIVRESECIGEPLFRVDDGRELHATAEQLSILHVAFVPDAFWQILKTDLLLIERADGFRFQRTIAAQHCHWQDGRCVGHQAGQPPHIGRPQLIMLPPVAVGANIWRTFILSLADNAVIERVRNEQVDAAYGQPVRVPLDVPAGKLPWIIILIAGSKALVGVAAAVHQAGSIRAALAKRGIQPHKAVFFRCNPAQAQILTGDAEIFLYLDITTLVRVSHQADAVLFAPAGKCRIVNAAFPVKDHLIVKLRIRIFGFLKQCGQIFQLTASFGEQLGKSLRPREHLLHVPSQNAGFIGEEANDGIAEVFFQFAVIGIVGQADESLHDLRVQNIRTFRGVRLAVIFAPVDAADGAAAPAYHQNSLRSLREDFISRLALAHQCDALTD